MKFLMARVGSCLSKAAAQSRQAAMTADLSGCLSSSWRILSIKQTTKCSIPIPFWPPNCPISILEEMSSIIQSFKKLSKTFEKSLVDDIFLRSLITFGCVTLGTGVTHSNFQRVGKTCCFRLLFIMIVSGSASSTENSLLNLFGRSSGKVERVFLSFCIF